MAKKKVEEFIAEWMEKFGPENGYELSRTEFVKEGSQWYLRVYADKLENGEYGIMSTDDCSFISHYLSDKLDEADPISHPYMLEVSSPGVDRPLISERDFIRFRGELVDVKLYKALDGKKLLCGRLSDYDGQSVSITDEKGRETTLPMDAVAKINLSVIF